MLISRGGETFVFRIDDFPFPCSQIQFKDVIEVAFLKAIHQIQRTLKIWDR